MNIYLKTSVLTEIVIWNQSFVASMFPNRTVKPVLSCNITNLKIWSEVNSMYQWTTFILIGLLVYLQISCKSHDESFFFRFIMRAEKITAWMNKKQKKQQTKINMIVNMAVRGQIMLFPAEWLCFFTESKTANLFFFLSVRIIFPLIHINSTTGSERTTLRWLWQRNGCMWMYQNKYMNK